MKFHISAGLSTTSQEYNRTQAPTWSGTVQSAQTFLQETPYRLDALSPKSSATLFTTLNRKMTTAAEDCLVFGTGPYIPNLRKTRATITNTW